MWNIFGDEIVEHLKTKASIIKLPVEDENGVEYLGRKYILKDVNIDDIY